MKLKPWIGQAKMRLMIPGEDEATKTVAVWFSAADVDEFESAPVDIVFATVTPEFAGKAAAISAAECWDNETESLSPLPEGTATSATERLISDCKTANFCEMSETLSEMSLKLFV
jgi:hypothetical protein